MIGARRTEAAAVLVAVLALAASPRTEAAMVEATVPYEVNGVSFEGVLVRDDAIEAQPVLLMVPNWMGVTADNVESARSVAAMGYVVFVADLYGRSIRPANKDEAGLAAGTVRADRAMMRVRANASLDVLLAHAAKARADTSRVGAIGFCFGGGAVLELARSGRALAGVVSFHGNLDTPNPADAANIRSRVLVLHGANDPYVPPAQVDAFEMEMRAQPGVDWQLVSFGNAVHSFTDPHAATAGAAHYDERASRRAFGLMRSFFEEAFGASGQLSGRTK